MNNPPLFTNFTQEVLIAKDEDFNPCTVAGVLCAKNMYYKSGQSNKHK